MLCFSFFYCKAEERLQKRVTLYSSFVHLLKRKQESLVEDRREPKILLTKGKKIIY